MKHARIMMVMLVLLGAASLAEAQIVVSSTTASTVKPKSGREKGWVVRPEVEIGSGIVTKGIISISGIACYQINPYWSVGGGIGYLYDFYGPDDGAYHVGEFLTFKSRPQSLPLFVNARVYFIDRKWSPFLDLKLGYMIPIKSGLCYWDGHNPDASRRIANTHTMRGFTISPTLGVQFMGFDFGITARMLNVYYADVDYYPDNDEMVVNYDSEAFKGYLGITIAYNFQLKKK